MKQGRRIIFIAFILPLALALALEDILEFLPSSKTTSSKKCCNDENLLSCQDVSIHQENFLEDEISFFSVQLLFSNEAPPYGRTYKNILGDELAISFNNKTGHFFASFDRLDGRIFSVEPCDNGHVFKEIDVLNVKPGMPVFDEDAPQTKLMQDEVEDNTTIVTYSVMFYYTREFAEITDDIEGFVDEAVAITNQGYINSQIPVRIEKFCIEEAPVREPVTSVSMFGYSKNTVEALRNTADAAALFVAKTGGGWGGVAWLTQASPYRTVSITVKSNVYGFVLAHEIGHNFGCHHDLYQQSLDPEGETNPWYNYGYGHHIEGGYRTILAYNKEGFGPRVNHHSNPSVILNQTGTPTGIAGLSNNAYVITKNRFAMAGNGDESGQCRAIGKNFLYQNFHIIVYLNLDEILTVSGKGTAAEAQSTNMGIFQREAGVLRNEKPVWKMKGRNQYIFYNGNILLKCLFLYCYLTIELFLKNI